MAKKEYTIYYLVSFLYLFLLSVAQAESNRIDLDKILNDKSKKKKESTTSVYFRYQNIGSQFYHNETSSSPGFEKLDKITQLGVSVMSLELSKEFFHKNYISFNILGRLGVSKAADSGNDDNDLFSYDENLSGTMFGAGLSANINMKGFGLKIQPFISSQYVVFRNDYELSYNSINNSLNANKVNIDYQTNENFMIHSAGVKFIDNEYNLMSYFSMDYYQRLSNEISSEGTLGGNEVPISSSEGPIYNDVGFSVGLGFLF